jgi:hypothetical protein
MCECYSIAVLYMRELKNVGKAGLAEFEVRAGSNSNPSRPLASAWASASASSSAAIDRSPGGGLISHEPRLAVIAPASAGKPCTELLDGQPVEWEGNGVSGALVVVRMRDFIVGHSKTLGQNVSSRKVVSTPLL